MHWILLLLFTFSLQLRATTTHYPLTSEPIDVVLVTHPKDKDTLDLAIDGIRTYGENIGKVFVVSSEKLTDNAYWFDESLYPFTKNDVALEIGKGSEVAASKFFNRGGHPVGWYYQQLLKLYAAYVILNISSNILVLDSDSVFISPVKFLNEHNGGLFCISRRRETKKHYCSHAERMLPSYKRVHPEVNSVNHHMLFQKPILDALFDEIEQHHKVPLWKVFCRVVDTSRKWGSGSEYELYYNFAINHTNQVSLQELQRRSSSNLDKIGFYKAEGYELLSFHSYMRQ